MNVNMKGAAQNNYNAIKSLCDLIDEFDSDNDDAGDFIDALNNIIIEYQPMLAAYCLLEHFNQNGENNENQN